MRDLSKRKAKRNTNPNQRGVKKGRKYAKTIKILVGGGSVFTGVMFMITLLLTKNRHLWNIPTLVIFLSLFISFAGVYFIIVGYNISDKMPIKIERYDLDMITIHMDNDIYDIPEQLVRVKKSPLSYKIYVEGELSYIYYRFLPESENFAL